MGAMRKPRLPSTSRSALLALPLLVACSAPRATEPPPRDPVAEWRDVADREWQLVALDGSPPIAGVDVTLAFDGDGRLFGTTGANRYFASVERDGDGGFVAGAAGSTRMFRDEPPGLMQQESRYLELLARVRGYRLVDGRLALLADGAPLLEYESR
jgi:heat shock protein HslJ